MMSATHARIKAKIVAEKKRLRAIALPITAVNQLKMALALNQSCRSPNP
jgi:hypothetical protein